MKTTFELNDARSDNLVVKEKGRFKRVCEICESLFRGDDMSQYGQEGDKIINRLKKLGGNAANGDGRAIAEINSYLKFIIEPKLTNAMKVFNFLGQYHEIKYNEQAMVRTYTYEGIEAREQASGSDVNFGTRKWIEYPVMTQTVSAGLAIDYREIESGNFDRLNSEMTSQVLVDMNNKSIAVTLEKLHDAVKSNTEYVRFYSEYDSVPTKTLVDNMISKMRRMGKVGIAGDFSNLSTICDWNGYKTLGETSIPFYSPEQVMEIAKVGLNGFYKGVSLLEVENPYNYSKPLEDKSGFESYYDTDKLYFTVQGQSSPLNIFKRGKITTMSGNDVETGVRKVRFDVEFGADVVKGREFEIGIIAKKK